MTGDSSPIGHLGQARTRDHVISDSDAHCSSQGKKMGGSAHLSYTLAALLASGGAYAFVRKGSKISLAAGCGVGALFAGSGRQ